MVKQSGKGKNASTKPRKLTYFYLVNGEGMNILYKTHYINRPADLITVWSYPEHKWVGYTYSDTLRRRGKAFTTSQVSKMINRSRVKVQQAIVLGHVSAPQYTYNIETYLRDGTDHIYKYMWSEEDVLELHDYFSSLHYGRPRKDGLVNPWPMPNRREIRALMRQDSLLYVKQGENFVPVWEAEHRS